MPDGPYLKAVLPQLPFNPDQLSLRDAELLVKNVVHVQLLVFRHAKPVIGQQVDALEVPELPIGKQKPGDSLDILRLVVDASDQRHPDLYGIPALQQRGQVVQDALVVDARPFVVLNGVDVLDVVQKKVRELREPQQVLPAGIAAGLYGRVDSDRKSVV